MRTKHLQQSFGFFPKLKQAHIFNMLYSDSIFNDTNMISNGFMVHFHWFIQEEF